MTVTPPRPPSNGKHVCSPEPNVYIGKENSFGFRAITEHKAVVGEPDGPRSGEEYTVVIGKSYVAGTLLTCDRCGKRYVTDGYVQEDHGTQMVSREDTCHRETWRERRRRERAERREPRRFESRKGGYISAGEDPLVHGKLPRVRNPGPADRPAPRMPPPPDRYPIRPEDSEPVADMLMPGPTEPTEDPPMPINVAPRVNPAPGPDEAFPDHLLMDQRGIRRHA